MSLPDQLRNVAIDMETCLLPKWPNGAALVLAAADRIEALEAQWDGLRAHITEVADEIERLKGNSYQGYVTSWLMDVHTWMDEMEGATNG